MIIDLHFIEGDAFVGDKIKLDYKICEHDKNANFQKDWMQTEFTIISIHPDSVNPDDFKYITPAQHGKRYELSRGKSTITYTYLYNNAIRKTKEIPHNDWYLHLGIEE
jgi:hypothetical protein